MNRILFVFLISLVVGCGQTQDIDRLCECFSLAAYEAIKAESLHSPAPPKATCCGKCQNGKVRSGDGLAWVDCPICPDDCPCRAKGKK